MYTSCDEAEVNLKTFIAPDCPEKEKKIMLSSLFVNYLHELNRIYLLLLFALL